MSKVMKTMDGNEAAAYASYAFTEVAAIYPITPSSPMAEHVDTWAAHGKKNIFGTPVKLVEMQSEAGAVSAVHGALDAGALATSYTASQGLMLMIPTMFRIAGQLKPGVIHVASRNVATSTISIFAEHSDVMACRQTGFAMLCSSTVQEAMDLGAVSHLAAIKGHVPFLHFFDGFRTSHEIQKVECLDYDKLYEALDKEELQKFRDESLTPEKPILRTTGQNADTYFQQREAVNPYYENLPDVVESCMGEINKITGKDYHLFNYYGAEDAEIVIVGMGSVTGTVQETLDYLASQGKKAGYLEVHLFRPFSSKYFLNALPKTVRTITVLDRDKEAGAVGEPLYEEVCAVLNDADIKVTCYACRFGLAGKDTTPAQIIAMYDNMNSVSPANHYTIGINDDVTHHSIPYGEEIDIIPKGTVSCKFWGLGSDGTVGANKNTIKIIGDHTDMNVQAYFEYDGKKSGGVTKSHLRFGNAPIRSAYLVNKADFVACHNQAYIRKYDLTTDLKEGGSLLLSTEWSPEELETHLPAEMEKAVHDKKINLYTINAVKIAAELGLGNRTNTVLQSAFFKIENIIPADDAARYMKGDSIPVSTFYNGYADGTMPQGTSKYEKHKALGGGIFMCFALYLAGNILGSLPGLSIIPGLAWTIILGIIIKCTGILPAQFEDYTVYSMNFALRALLPMLIAGIGINSLKFESLTEYFTPGAFIVIITVLGAFIGACLFGHLTGLFGYEAGVTAGLCCCNIGGSGDLAVLSAANRMNLLAFASISTRIGGALMVIWIGILYPLFH